MQRLNRTTNRSSYQGPRVTRFIKNVATIVDVLAEGFLPLRHDTLPVPFRSFAVETDAGKQYIVRVRGREAHSLGEVKVGYTLAYAGNYFKPRFVGDSWKGGFFEATSCEVIASEVDEYTKMQMAEKARIIASGIEELPAQ
jgi:hypothetical protein